jgi:hypothetical protein
MSYRSNATQKPIIHRRESGSDSREDSKFTSAASSSRHAGGYMSSTSSRGILDDDSKYITTASSYTPMERFMNSASSSGTFEHEIGGGFVIGKTKPKPPPIKPSNFYNKYDDNHMRKT